MNTDWPIGLSENGHGARIVVHLVMDAKGGMHSKHEPMSEIDVKALRDMPGGGMNQAALALLVEAVRRETFTSALAMLKNDAAILDTVTPELEAKLAQVVLDQVVQNASAMVSLAAKQVLAMLQEQVATSKPS